MTNTLVADEAITRAIVRAARRAWYRAGVRRRDRHALAAELHQDLAAAADSRDVLGDDPAVAARDWAAERGLTDRRLRLPVVWAAALIPAVFASGAVLALLYEAFTNNGDTILNHFSSWIVLAMYFATGVAAYAAMVVGVASALAWLHDSTAGITARTLAAVLPVGAVLTTFAGVGTAAAEGFRTDRHSVTLDIGTVLLALLVVLTAGRIVAVHRKRA